MKKIHFLAVFGALFLLTACNREASDVALEVIEPEAVEITAEELLADLDSTSELAEVAIKEPVEAEQAASPNYKTGAMQTYSADLYNEAVADGKKVLLDFYASWCHVCRDNAPNIDSALEQDGDVVGLKVNYDTAQDLRAKYGVVSQSTLILLDSGKEVTRAMGSQSVDSVLDLLSS